MENHHFHFWIVARPQEAQGGLSWPQDGLKMDQHGPTMAPRTFQMAPRWLQAGPNKTQEILQNPENKKTNGKSIFSLLDCILGPRSPRMTEEGFKMAPRWPSMASRRPQEAPRWPQQGPRNLSKSCQTCATNRSFCSWTAAWPQEAPRQPSHGPRNAPRWDSESPQWS